jgi:hypothetical protein
MPSLDSDEPAGTHVTAAYAELTENLDYARDLIRGGRYLERLKVGAFDIADLYRAAVVQAVAALDHWIHQELYGRALAFASDIDSSWPTKLRTLRISLDVLEHQDRKGESWRAAFTTEMQNQFGYRSFQAPEKIKEAVALVTDAPLWESVAKEFNVKAEYANAAVSAKDVKSRLQATVDRRNRIAHEADRDPDRIGERAPLSDEEATEAVDLDQQPRWRDTTSHGSCPDRRPAGRSSATEKEVESQGHREPTRTNAQRSRGSYRS